MISVAGRESHKFKYISICVPFLVPKLPFPPNFSLAALAQRKYNSAVSISKRPLPWTSGAEGSNQTFPCATHKARPKAGSFCFPRCMSPGKTWKRRLQQQQGERMTCRSDYIQASDRDKQEEWAEDIPWHAVWYCPRVERDGWICWHFKETWQGQVDFTCLEP